MRDLKGRKGTSVKGRAVEASMREEERDGEKIGMREVVGEK